MIILITGGTGFVGSALIQKLKKEKHKIYLLVRSFTKQKDSSLKEFLWLDTNQELPLEAFPKEEDYGIIHLLGEPISQWPWTSRKKKKIYDSRVMGTKNLVETIKTLPNKPQFFLAASATGIYGNQHSKEVFENSPIDNPHLFLQKVCQDWEEEVLKLQELSRVIILRLGLVLSFQGGFLKTQLKWSQAFVPIMMYRDKLWLSWIHREDLVSLIYWILFKKQIKGIYNATSPQPFDMNSFFDHVSTHLKKKYLRIPQPLFLMRLLGGEMIKNLLVSCYVSSKKILEEGFEFKYKNLEDVFKNPDL